VDNIKINGIEAGLPVKGIGTLKWTIWDDNHNELDTSALDKLPCKHSDQETDSTLSVMPGF
jgi:hypothetical protein